MERLTSEAIEKAVLGFGFTFNHQLHKSYELEKIADHVENNDYDEFDEQALFDAMSFSELSICDCCMDIDLSQQLHWVNGEELGDNEDQYALVYNNYNYEAVCDSCLSAIVEKTGTK